MSATINRRPPMHGPVRKPQNAKKSIRRLLSYIGADKVKVLIVLVFVALNTLSGLAGSYMLRPIINNLAANIKKYHGEKEAILKYGSQALIAGLTVMAVVYLVGILSSYLQSRIMIEVSQRALLKIRNELFEKTQNLPIQFFDTNNTGELMSRFTNDVDTIGEMMNNTIVQLFSGFITVVGTLALMLYTNVWLTLITIAMMPLYTKAGGAIAKRSRKFYSAQQAALGDLNGYIEETVTGQKVVKVFCHEDVAMKDFEVKNRTLREQQVKAQFVGGIMGPVVGNLSQIGYALTATVGGILCAVNRFDVGGLSVFLNISRHFSRPLNELSMQVNIIFSALAGAERVFAIMDTPPEEEDGPDAIAWNCQTDGKVDGLKEGVILSHVTFGYRSEKVILKDISLYAKPRQKIAFVGSTGAGKTTITNLLNRFYDIWEGTITIDGMDIRSIARDKLRENVAMVLQDTHLFTGTVRENIRYGRLDATDEEIEQAAKMASAHSFIMRLENGYETRIEGDGSNLSQGQRQLLNIARAAVSKAPILVLDEATSSVDTRTEKHIEHGMDRLMAERTTFVIAHRLSTVRNSDAIMVLENGEIIERGSHSELLELKGRYYELYTGKAELD